MKKIGRFIQKIAILLIFLLILCTIGIFLYPKISDKTDADDKIVQFLSGQTSSTEGSSVEEELIGDISVSENDPDTDTDTEETLPEEESTAVYQDSYLVQTLSAEEKKAINTAYNTVLHKMQLQSDNLRFYEIKDYDGTDYYTFQVVDDFGGAYPDLLYYNPSNYNVYWHDENGFLAKASSSDSIFSGTVAGNKDVDYEDDTWEKVFNAYMQALLTDCDNDKASSYIDSSCYYLPKLSEARRDTFVDATKENQTFLIEEGESLQERKTSKKIDSYKWNYNVLRSEEYIDEYDMDWKEVHIALDLDVTAHKNTDQYRDYYCVYLREYEYGWRIAALIKE